MSVLKHHTVKIEALSPIFIGSGEKIGKKEYIYLPWDHRVIIPDINKMYTAIQRKGHGRQFEEYMLKNSQDALGVWLKRWDIRRKIMRRGNGMSWKQGTRFSQRQQGQKRSWLL